MKHLPCFNQKIIINKTQKQKNQMIFKSYVKLSWKIPIISNNRNWLHYLINTYTYFWFMFFFCSCCIYFFSFLLFYDLAPTSRFIEFIFVLFITIQLFFAICKLYYFFDSFVLCGWFKDISFHFTVTKIHFLSVLCV